MIICADKGRAEYLRELEQFDRSYTGPWDHVRSIDQALDVLKRAKSHRFLLISMAGGRFTEADLQLLKPAATTSIIVELEGDDPDRAYTLLAHGACRVISPVNLQLKKLWKIVSKVSPGHKKQPDEPYLESEYRIRPMENWGFMCMRYEETKAEHCDYFHAIKPTMDRLGLDLKRCDEIATNESNLVAQVEEGIRKRKVLVVFVSSPADWISYELGFARGLGKAVLPLYREFGGEQMRTTAPRLPILDWLVKRPALERGGERERSVPDYLMGHKLVKYSTMTQLAMTLFFGLGGTPADLLDTDRAFTKP
jgi:hypothetical protein